MKNGSRPTSPDSDNDSHISWSTQRTQMNKIEAMEEEMKKMRREMTKLRKRTVQVVSPAPVQRVQVMDPNRASNKKVTTVATNPYHADGPTRASLAIFDFPDSNKTLKARNSHQEDHGIEWGYSADRRHSFDQKDGVYEKKEKHVHMDVNGVSWTYGGDVDNRLDQKYGNQEAYNDDVIDLSGGGEGESEDERAGSKKLTSSFSRTFKSFIHNSNTNAMELPLRHDTFSLMMITSPGSQSWALGIGTFLFEATLGAMILYNQIKTEDIRSSVLNIPIMVEPVVSVGQFFAIILSITSQDDLYTSIQAFISLEMDSNWDQVIGLKREKTTYLWVKRILIPNSMKFLLGVMVCIMSFVLIVQSENIIDLITNVSALLVISSMDNFLFGMAEQGYLGETLQAKTSKVNEVNVHDTHLLSALSLVERKRSYKIRSAIFISFFVAMVGGWGTVLYRQMNGKYFREKYPHCIDSSGESYFPLAKKHFGDDKCFGGPLNSLKCGFEQNECAYFNFAYPLCKGDGLKDVEDELGNGTCSDAFATYECDFDGGDCCPYNITKSPDFGDGQCNGGIINTKRCGYDNGDCLSFTREYPFCTIKELPNRNVNASVILGDGICDSTAYASNDCGYEYGDCDIGQTGQDIRFRGLSSASSIEFNTRMSSDGSTLIIGIPFSEIKDGKWQRRKIGEKSYLEASQGRVLIYRYNSIAETWEEEIDFQGEEKTEMMGIGVAVNSNGTKIAIGAPHHNLTQGYVKTYEFGAINRKLVAYGKAMMGHFPDLTGLGYRVDMSDDGTRLAIAASLSSYFEENLSYAGRIQIFDMDPFNRRWTQIGADILGHNPTELIGRYGLLLNSSGSRIFFSTSSSKRIGIPGEGASVRVYEYDNSNFRGWLQLGNDMMNPNPPYHSFTINGNGNRIAIASNSTLISRPGQVQVFDLDTSANIIVWKQLGPTIFGVSSEKGDGFGYSTSMSADGSMLAISSIQPECTGIPGFCATGSIQLYHYKSTNHPHHPFARVPIRLFGGYPNTMQLSKRTKDNNIMGLHLSLTTDGSRMSVSGYDFIHDMGFVKIYDVDKLYHSKCIVPKIERIGDGVCDRYEPYYTKECSFDGGDCPGPTLVEGYEDCLVDSSLYIGDGFCAEYPPFNTEKCSFDGGDCPVHVQVEKYKDCYVSRPDWIGDGKCDDMPPYNGYACGFDDGDCL